MTDLYVELRDWLELIGWAVVGAALCLILAVGLATIYWYFLWFVIVRTV